MADVFACLIILSPFVMAGAAFVALLYQDRAKLPKIKFKDFKKFYELNPNRWDLCSDCVSCDVGNDSRNEVFVFSFMDYFRYKLWRCTRDKHEINERCAQSIQLMLDAVKEDVENAKAKERDAVISRIIKDLNNTPLNNEIPSLIELLKKYSADVKEQ